MGRYLARIPKTGVPLAQLRDQLDRTLGSIYRIERELGGGGMSRDFLAVSSGMIRSSRRISYPAGRQIRKARTA